MKTLILIICLVSSSCSLSYDSKSGVIGLTLTKEGAEIIVDKGSRIFNEK